MSKDAQSIRFVKTGENPFDERSWQPAYYRITNKEMAHGHPVHIEELRTALHLLLQSKEFREAVSNSKQ